jgi:hypothetical protein
MKTVIKSTLTMAHLMAVPENSLLVLHVFQIFIPIRYMVPVMNFQVRPLNEPWSKYFLWHFLIQNSSSYVKSTFGFFENCKSLKNLMVFKIFIQLIEYMVPVMNFQVQPLNEPWSKYFLWQFSIENLSSYMSSEFGFFKNCKRLKNFMFFKFVSNLSFIIYPIWITIWKTWARFSNLQN